MFVQFSLDVFCYVPATTGIYPYLHTLSLHVPLPIWQPAQILKLGPLLAVAAVFALLAGTAGATHERRSPAQLVRVAVPTLAGFERLENSGLDLSEQNGRAKV